MKPIRILIPSELLTRLWVAMKVYTSKDQLIDVEEYKEFCRQTIKLIWSKFNNAHDGAYPHWIKISPTVHGLLAHSWELIENNDRYGLGEFSEAGLEHNNKFLRLYRRTLARKRSQKTNLEDCITRLWMRSDPMVRAAAPTKTCKRCSETGHYTVSCKTKQQPEVATAATKESDYLAAIFV